MKLMPSVLCLVATTAAMTAKGRLEARRLPNNAIIGENLDGLPDCYASNPVPNNTPPELPSPFANADHLPLSQKECMIEKANVVKNLPILKLNVKDFCDMPNWIRVGSWVDWHYIPCVDKKCPWPRNDSERGKLPPK